MCRYVRGERRQCLSVSAVTRTSLYYSRQYRYASTGRVRWLRRQTHVTRYRYRKRCQLVTLSSCIFTVGKTHIFLHITTRPGPERADQGSRVGPGLRPREGLPQPKGLDLSVRNFAFLLSPPIERFSGAVGMFRACADGEKERE